MCAAIQTKEWGAKRSYCASREGKDRITRRKTGPRSVYFRGVNYYQNVNVVDWYTFVLDGDGNSSSGGDGIPILTSFSKSKLSPLATVVGLNNSFIYSLGGRCDEPPGVVKEVHIFDTSNPGQGWLRGPDMNIPRQKPNVVVADGKIYVMGGTHTSLGFDPDVWAECLDPSTGEWEFLSSRSELASLTLKLSPPDKPTYYFYNTVAAFGPGRREILMVSLDAVYSYNTIDRCLKELEKDDFNWENFPRCTPVVVGSTLYWLHPLNPSLLAYDMVQKKNLYMFIYGCDAHLPQDSTLLAYDMIGLDGLCADDVDINDTPQLCSLWFYPHDKYNTRLICLTIKVSKEIESEFGLRAVVTSSKSFLVPRLLYAYGGILLDGKLGETKKLELADLDGERRD